MDMQTAINQVLSGQNLSTDDMTSVMKIIMTGEATQAQIGGFLVGLRMKGETVDEITGAATVMRELSSKVAVSGDHMVDTCGTGGDGAGIFNVSTASSFVVAAGGGTVAKHGNRSVTSSSGSADVLEAAGVNLDLTPEQVGRCIDSVGLGFMFAVKHHGAMKHAIGPRKELGARTIFNLLGPLTNPATAPNQVLGVFSKQWVRPMAEVLKRLGSEHVMVVHAEDGLDEISVSGTTFVAELKDGEITEYTVSPNDFGIETSALDTLVVDSADASLALIKSIFAGDVGPASDIVALNAGAALYVAGLAMSLKEGVATAQDIIASGQAKEKLSEFVEFTQLCAN